MFLRSWLKFCPHLPANILQFSDFLNTNLDCWQLPQASLFCSHKHLFLSIRTYFNIELLLIHSVTFFKYICYVSDHKANTRGGRSKEKKLDRLEGGSGPRLNWVELRWSVMTV